jgi:hypothetical protein
VYRYIITILAACSVVISTLLTTRPVAATETDNTGSIQAYSIEKYTPASLPPISERLQDPGGAPINLEVVVITVADDDGANDAATTFSDATIRALIDATNAIYISDVGIKLTMKKIVRLRSTLINRLADWSIPNCPDAEQTIPNPNPDFAGWFLSPSQHAAYQYAAENYPNQIVVYIRRQTYDANCNVVDEGGGGFSHSDLNFIALSSWGATGELGLKFPFYSENGQAPPAYLAHELGHYLGLTHTMPNEWPLNQEQATAQLDTFCQNNPSLITMSLPDLAWNLDQLSDTAGDPGYHLYNQTVFNVDPVHVTPTENQCVGAGFFEVTSELCQTIGDLASRDFVVTPPRANVMSYTADCPYFPNNTTGETRARITTQQAAVILQSLLSNRQNLLATRTADLKLTLEVNRHHVRAGDNVVFLMTVENRGRATAQDVTFSKDIRDEDGNPVAFYCVPPAVLQDDRGCYVDALSPGQTVAGIAVLTPEMNPNIEGLQFMSGAGVSSSTPDANESNNWDEVEIVIVKSDRADLVPALLSADPAEYCVHVTPGEYGIDFVIRNEGTQTARASMTAVEFLMEGEIVTVDVPIPAIAAGESFNPGPISTPPGCFVNQDCAFIITADITGRIYEKFENNNSTRGSCDA